MRRGAAGGPRPFFVKILKFALDSRRAICYIKHIEGKPGESRWRKATGPSPGGVAASCRRYGPPTNGDFWSVAPRRNAFLIGDKKRNGIDDREGAGHGDWKMTQADF